MHHYAHVGRLLLIAAIFALLWVRCVAMSESATTSLAQAALAFFTLFVLLLASPGAVVKAIRWSCLLVAANLFIVVCAADVAIGEIEEGDDRATVDIVTLVLFLITACVEVGFAFVAYRAPAYEVQLLEEDES
jgi:O-antigen ligase